MISNPPPDTTQTIDIEFFRIGNIADRKGEMEDKCTGIDRAHNITGKIDTL